MPGSSSHDDDRHRCIAHAAVLLECLTAILFVLVSRLCSRQALSTASGRSLGRWIPSGSMGSQTDHAATERTGKGLGGGSQRFPPFERALARPMHPWKGRMLIDTGLQGRQLSKWRATAGTFSRSGALRSWLSGRAANCRHALRPVNRASRIDCRLHQKNSGRGSLEPRELVNE